MSHVNLSRSRHLQLEGPRIYIQSTLPPLFSLISLRPISMGRPYGKYICQQQRKLRKGSHLSNSLDSFDLFKLSSSEDIKHSLDMSLPAMTLRSRGFSRTVSTLTRRQLRDGNSFEFPLRCATCRQRHPRKEFIVDGRQPRGHFTSMG